MDRSNKYRKLSDRDMPKKRNTRYKLTWVKQKRHWRKIYRGRAYVFKPLDGEGQAESYQRCLSEWLDTKAELDAKEHRTFREQNASYIAPAQTALATKIQSLIDAFGDSDQLRFFVRQLLDMEARAEAIAKSTEDSSDTVHGREVNHAEEAADAILWDADQLGTVPLEDQLRHEQAARDALGAPSKPPAGRPPWEAPTTATETLQGAVSAFLKEISESKSRSRLMACRKALRLFTEHLPASCELTAEALTSEYLASFADAIKTKYPNNQTAFQRSQPVQQFTKWCYQRELIDHMPRLLEKGSLIPRAKPTDRGTFRGIDDLRRWLFCENRLIKTVCLLIANTGLTQGDLAGLSSAAIDGQHLDFARKKTGIGRRWLLWPETIAAIDEVGLPLLTPTGLLLVDEEGRDRFRGVVRNYCDTNKIKLLKPRRFRSASASLLNTSDTNARFTQHWLAHRPTSIADTHYVTPDQDQFDSAVRWLRDAWLS